MGWNLVRVSAINPSANSHTCTHIQLWWISPTGLATQKKTTAKCGTSVSQHPSPFVLAVLSPNTTYSLVLYFLQRYADIFNHFLCWLTGRDYFTLRLLHWGEWVQRIQWIYCFIMLYFLSVQLASCTLNKVYISSTLILSVIVSIVAILPWVQKGATIS